MPAPMQNENTDPSLANIIETSLLDIKDSLIGRIAWWTIPALLADRPQILLQQ